MLASSHQTGSIPVLILLYRTNLLQRLAAPFRPRHPR
jgi:hypothetical protein